MARGFVFLTVHKPNSNNTQNLNYKVPAIAGDASLRLRVQSILAWARRRVAEDWSAMKNHKPIADDWGPLWWQVHGRVHNSWSKRLPFRKRVGRRCHLEKFPELRKVLKDADEMHGKQRKRKKHCDFDGLVTTAKACLQMKNAELNDMDEPQIKGPKLSRSWMYVQSRALKAKTQRTSSTEPKSADPEERKQYWAEHVEKLKQCDDVKMQQSWDEFNGFNDRSSTHVLTHREEELARKGHVKKASRGRESWTGGLCYGPLHKGFALYAGRNIPQETLDQLYQDYGRILKVVSTPSGNFIE